MRRSLIAESVLWITEFRKLHTISIGPAMWCFLHFDIRQFQTVKTHL